MASSGDIRVLLVIDLVLSLAFGALALFALSMADIAEFTPVNVALATAVLAVLTYVVVLRE
ncbi:hypothetical protein [Halorarum halobium]|uniref:hypothetical protein n=1 Tax=Halorarum halobium TaxID=3075121 RepID=UPI0028A8F4D7|nr:hypothetical protein [Halobaculum sp. XH14]